MFSKVKCPNCGTKNSKERMVCIECGSSLTSEQVERQLSQVSTEAEVEDKTVIEQELKDKIDDEYRDNEKVLFKTLGRLIHLGKGTEEAYCFITEGHVVIEAKEPIKIPLSCIQDCRLSGRSYRERSFFYGGYGGDTTILTFVDDTNKKYELYFEMVEEAGGNFKRILAKHVEFPTGFFDKVVDKVRDWIGETWEKE